MSEFRILTITESNSHVFVERDMIRESDFQCAIDGTLHIKLKHSPRDIYWVKRSLDDLLKKYYHFQWADTHLYVATNIYNLKKVEKVIDMYMSNRMKRVRYNE